MKQKRKLGRELLSFLLTLALVLGLMPGMGLTAYAEDTEPPLTTITATAKEQANYSMANVATVSFSYTAGGSSAYVANWGWWGYGWSATVTPADGYTITKCVFYDDADRTATDSSSPFVVETTEADKTPQVNGTPILASTSKGIKKIEVYGYATPTATHSVTITAGDHMTKTAGSGDAEQTGLTGAMTDVVYTADNGYYFPITYSVEAVNEISVTRDSYTQITVSGTPTADTEITLTAPTEKTTPSAPTLAAAVNCTTADNNDGKLTGVTTAMEYQKSGAAEWTAGTGSDITGLVPGTYYVRYKETDTTNVSGNQELTIAGYTAPSFTVTYKVVNGTWSDNSTTDKTETVQSGSKPASVPTGMKAAEGYTGGSWDKNPADTTITEATTFTYTFTEKQKVATPTFSPAAGTYTAAQSVEISCTTDGAEIYYTTDGSDPSASSTKYSSAIAVGETTTIKAIAVKDGMTDSSVASATYTINIPPQTVATPAFSPDAGTYTEAQSVTISCETTGATIYYTTDGSDPSASSTAYSGAITVGETTTIKAIAVKEGMTDSAVTSATYTISEAPEKETKVEVEGLSERVISDDLKGSGYTSVESIGTALETALSIETEEEKERSKLVDVKLMISTDGGINWDEATAQNFPAGGIDVVLPYPDGTNGDEYSFSVAHMIGTSANGKTAGEIEKPGTTNTSSGISTHFNGLSPVMITWTKNSSPSKDDGKSEEKAHTHHYVWETVEATENSDGELRYKCDICGDIQTRVPITAYYVFNKNTSEKIRKAGQGAIVKIETSRWISFHKMVMQALADRPDVSLEVSFLDGEYKGNRVSFTIPAGTDTLSLLDENGFSGFLYLAGKFGTAN